MQLTPLEEAQRAIEAIPSLDKPPVYFPDLKYKEKTEAPASIAVATRGTIIPTLTAPSLGCSMGVIKTSLTEHDMNDKFFEELFRHLPDETGKRYGLFYNLLRLVGLKHREKKKYDLNYKELEEVLKGGEDLDLRGIVPKPAWVYGRHDIGYGFKGNHFVEVQVVDEIFDKQKADELGIKQGQVMIMYHGGGGTVPYYIGRFFGNRRKNTARQRIIVGIGKIFFHFFSRDAFKRLRYYFFPRKYEAIPLDSREGKRLMTAMRVAENYSAHWNKTMCRRVIDALHKTTVGQNEQAEPVVAKIHNTIREECGLVVHRHTVNRVREGELTIIAGSKMEPSYIAIGGEEVNKYLNSADHGTGGNESVITMLVERGIIELVAKCKPLKTFKQ